jgi:ketosteroid isomerase-like protein
MMASNIELVRRTYASDPVEKLQALAAVAAPDIEWTEAAGFPYAGTYRGLEAISAGVFHRLGTEWDGYQAEPHTFVGDDKHVAVFGVYSGTFKATGKSMTSPFAHLYEFRNGKIVRMTQYVDTLLVARAVNRAIE